MKALDLGGLNLFLGHYCDTQHSFQGLYSSKVPN